MEPQVTRKAFFRRLPGCSAAALAIALAAVPAHAQSFNANGTVASGLASITAGAGTTTIDIDSPEVVINWTPTDTFGSGTINFQNQNTTATFQTQISSNTPNYTVLNRILPQDPTGGPSNRAVQFNGTVESFAQSSPGGRVWFYSPTGIIAGPTSTFNVGSLLLTTNDIDTTGGLYGPGNTVRFRGTAGSTGFVSVNPGAQLSTTADSGDYIAIVASRITQSGTLTSLGQTALVAAEQADIAINAGLLDIVVTQGTTDGNGIVHDGTSTGPASTGPANPQIIQMVAMPKNTALTMLLSGNIGYAPAAAAVVDGSAIVLQAGVAPYVAPATQALGLGNITIGNTVFTNAVKGDASNTIAIQPVSGLVDFQRDAALTAGRTITATAETGEEIRGGQSLFLNATQAGTGGTATVLALGSGANSGLIDVTGSLVLDASGFAFVPPVPADDGADGLGGTARMIADGGRIRGGTIDVLAIGAGAGGNLNGGDGRGNIAELSIGNNGSISAAAVFIGAQGEGGNGFLTGGNGFGGTATATFTGGPLTTDFLTVAADAFGGQSNRQTGNATGGKATAQVTSGTQTWGALNIAANATGGQTFAAGSIAGSATGQADGARLIVSGPGTSLRLFNQSSVRADAIASINDAPGAPAASATAGGANVSVTGGALLNVSAGLVVSADASVDSESYAPNPDTTPSVTGGDARLTADNGRVTAYALTVSARATGAGATASGGAATGGDALAEASNGGRFTVNLDDGGGQGTVLVVADGYGGNGPAPSQAQGGTARLTASDAIVTAQGSTIVSANGTGGPFTAQTLGTGYAATGGSASLEALSGSTGTTTFTLRDVVVRADGIANGGASPVSGNGGVGTGGNATLIAAAGTITALSTSVQAQGGGSNSAAIISGAPYRSGDGQGGTARADITGGGVTVTGAFSVQSQGFGAGGGAATAGALPAISGNGTGGSSTLNVAAGSIQAATMLVDATGSGGQGMANFSSGPGNGGDGGNGQGGTARFITPVGGSGSAVASGTMRVLAEGVGGAGGTASTSSGSNGLAGSGSGGTAGMDLRSGDFVFGPVSLSSDGRPGGLVTLAPSNAGSSSFSLIDPTLGAARNRRFDSLTLNASSISGNSGSTGLTMQVGDAGSALRVLGNFTATATGTTTPALAGNGFSAQISGAPLVIGADAFIATDRDIAMTVGTGGKFDGQAALILSTPRTVTTTGLIGSGGNAQIQGALGITMTDLLSGGTTLLSAPGGAVTVSNDLESTGPVTVLGRAVDLTSLGALTFADADATAGNLRIRTAGNLNTAAVDASGTVTLGSTGGTFTATAPITAGSNLAIDATGGITAPTVNSGGTTLLQATGGAISVATSVNSPGLVTVFGQSANILSTGSLAFADADATAGDLTIRTAGNLDVATVDASGAITLTSTSGSVRNSGALNGNGLTITAANNVIADGPIATSGALTVTAGATFTGPGNIVAGGAVSIDAVNGVSAQSVSSGGTTLLRATGGAVAVSGNLASAGAVTALGRSVSITSTGGLTFADADATAGDLVVSAGGPLSMATADATGALALATSTGNLRATGAINGSSIALNAAGGIQLDATATTGGTFQASTGGTFASTGTVGSGGNASIVAAQGITMATLNSGGTTLLRATGGPVNVASLLSAGPVTVQGQSVAVASTGGLTFADADATAGNLGIQTGGDLNVATVDATGAVTLASTGGSLRNSGAVNGASIALNAANSVTADANLAASGALQVNAGGNFQVNGRATGATIAATSGDIGIGAEGQLGARGSTQTILLTNRTPTNRTLIGGANPTGGYAISSAEAARLFADQRITITTPNDTSAPADFVIGDLALSYGGTAGNLGAGGMLKVDAFGRVAVNGMVRLTTSSAADTFSIDPTRIEVIADQGGIIMRNASGALTGQLELAADTVLIGTAANIAAVDAVDPLPQVNALLDAPSTVPSDGGYLQAGHITVRVSSGFFGQNSGLSTGYPARRGFTANSMAISTTAPDTQISINGQIVNDAGIAVTGVQAVPLIDINGAPAAAGGQFDPQSTINGCTIGSSCGSSSSTVVPRSTIDVLLGTARPGSGAFRTVSIGVDEKEEDKQLPLVDEPVTGVGNDDLWPGVCGPDSTECDKEGNGQ